MSGGTVSINYEAEYNRLLCDIEKACAEASCWKEKFYNREKELMELRAKIEVVELIFGGRG